MEIYNNILVLRQKIAKFRTEDVLTQVFWSKVSPLEKSTFIDILFRAYNLESPHKEVSISKSGSHLIIANEIKSQSKSMSANNKNPIESQSIKEEEVIDNPNSKSHISSNDKNPIESQSIEEKEVNYGTNSKSNVSANDKDPIESQLIEEKEAVYGPNSKSDALKEVINSNRIKEKDFDYNKVELIINKHMANVETKILLNVQEYTENVKSSILETVKEEVKSAMKEPLIKLAKHNNNILKQIDENTKKLNETNRLEAEAIKKLKEFSSKSILEIIYRAQKNEFQRVQDEELENFENKAIDKAILYESKKVAVIPNEIVEKEFKNAVKEVEKEKQIEIVTVKDYEDNLNDISGKCLILNAVKIYPVEIGSNCMSVFKTARPVIAPFIKPYRRTILKKKEYQLALMGKKRDFFGEIVDLEDDDKQRLEHWDELMDLEKPIITTTKTIIPDDKVYWFPQEESFEDYKSRVMSYRLL